MVFIVTDLMRGQVWMLREIEGSTIISFWS